jgi:hypothetical protein
LISDPAKSEALQLTQLSQLRAIFGIFALFSAAKSRVSIAAL